MTGPQFLKAWWTGVAAITLVSMIMRRVGRQMDAPVEGAPKLDPYEVAFLQGGAPLVVNAAIVALVHAKVLQHDGARNLMVSGELMDRAHAAERTVYDAVGEASGRNITAVRTASLKAVEKLGERLETLGLIANSPLSAKVTRPIRAMFIALMMAGGAKMLIGISRGRPVGFLLLSEILVLLIALAACSPLGRTSWGDAVLDLLKAESSPLETTARRYVGALKSSEVALAVALFGVTVLPEPALDGLVAMFKPDPGSGSSCSSGSCGGGGGCGGGGCGGCGG